jgi:asparagine synthase (glutamine-hydrolysing)
MCAIFGTVGKADIELVKKISDIQIFRGPDEQNFYVSKDNLVSFGNNRLSVIDKTNGKQPMISNNKRFTAVFNGCIYNFKEIKKFLISKNIKFKTDSDTEVVVNSYEYFGAKSFNYFDGMWAVAIHDNENNDVILSRDYVGQKPLYYSKNEKYYIFSSQLNGILVDNEVKLNLSKDNLKKYFAYSHVPAPKTIFDNIFQLEAGENLIINPKNLNYKKIKYWDLSNGPDYNIFNNKVNKDNFNSNFKNIIYEHSISDMNPAVSLSSGIDSYIIMKYLTKINRNFKSFTLGFENNSYDESRFIKNININKDKNILIANDESLKKNFIEMSKFLQDPIGDSSILPTFIIHKKIKENSNVTLGGDGGDESFFGYITFDAFYLGLVLKKIIPNFILKLFSKINPFKNNSSNYLSFSSKVRKFLSYISLKKEYLLPAWLGCLNNKDMNILFGSTIFYKELFEDSNKLFDSDKNLMRSCQLYHFKYYLPMVLAKVDQASMFNSVESRSPFLSKKVINFSLDQKTSNLYRLFNKKKFVKKTFKDMIPADILKRKKHGFAFPKEEILNDQKLIDSLLDYKILINENFFRAKYSSFIKKREDCSQYLWNELILNLSIQNLRKIRSF